MSIFVNKTTFCWWKFAWVSLIIAFPLVAKGQLVDSLFLAHTDKNGIVNVKAVLDEGKKYVYTNPSLTPIIAERAVSVAEKQKRPLAVAQSYQFMAAVWFQTKADYDSTAHYLDQAEKIYSTLQSEDALNGMGMVYHNYGTLKQVLGDYSEAFDYYIKALKLFDETENTTGRPYTLNNIATLYELVGDADKTEVYARRCIDLSRKVGDEFMEVTGSIVLLSSLMQQKRFEEAVPLLEKIKEYGEKNDDLYKKFLYHFNRGAYLINHKKDYSSAIQEYEKARQLAESVGDEWEIMRHYSALSEAYLENRQMSEAYKAAENTLSLAKKLKSKDKQEISLSVMAQVNARNNDYENAYQQLYAAYLLKDTLFDENNQRHIAFLESEYQTEKKEIRIESLEKQRQLYIWLGLAGVVICLIAFALAVIRYRLAVSRRKLAEKEAQRLEQEKHLVAVQATLDGEAAERSRLAKDLHDGLGCMLSLVKFNLPDVKGAGVLEAVDISRFQKALGMLDDSIQELRRVAHHMMPESLLRHGLKVSLSDFCAAIPNVDFHYFGNETRLSEKLEIMIYRCIHELVNNALKHAQATQINVQLVQEEDRLSFTVHDNGVGFDQEQTTEGMGLKNVRQRVTTFQGKMNVYSSPKGTEIYVELELPHEDENG